jgi:hypothetical protein
MDSDHNQKIRKDANSTEILKERKRKKERKTKPCLILTFVTMLYNDINKIISGVAGNCCQTAHASVDNFIAELSLNATLYINIKQEIEKKNEAFSVIILIVDCFS